MSDRMPDPRLASRGRHRAQAPPPSPRRAPRLPSSFRPGTTARGALVLGLVLALGGYTAAESTTQRNTAIAQRAAVVTAAAERATVAGERAVAVEAARGSITGATAVQTAVAAHVSATDLAVLADAVDHLAALMDDVRADSADPADPADPASVVAGSDERASRGVAREPLPDPASTAGAGSAADSGAAPDTAAGTATDTAADTAADTATDTAADVAAATAADATSLAAALAASDAAQAQAQAPLAAATSTGAGDAFRASGVAAVPDDALAAGILAASVRVANLTERLRVTADAVVAAAAEAAATAAEAERVAAAAAELASQRASLAAYANGRVPADALCELGFAPGQQLRCDAAEALNRLNASYQAAFGNDLVVTDSYRSYAAQVACSRTKGQLCATPGTSNHGRGVAVDLGDGIQVYTSVEHKWMAAHAGTFGWELPEWASISGSKHEPWHWEFTG